MAIQNSWYPVRRPSINHLKIRRGENNEHKSSDKCHVKWDTSQTSDIHIWSENNLISSYLNVKLGKFNRMTCELLVRAFRSHFPNSDRIFIAECNTGKQFSNTNRHHHHHQKKQTLLMITNFVYFTLWIAFYHRDIYFISMGFHRQPINLKEERKKNARFCSSLLNKRIKTKSKR